MSSTKTAVPAPGGSFLPGGLAAIRRSTVFYPLVGLIVVCVVMTFASDTFLSAGNITNILRQVSINAIIAVGMTLVILTGGIDLSVGAVMALSGTLAAGLMAGGINGGIGILVCLGVGLGFGLANGAFVAYAKMPPIIVTLATMGIARGLALIYTGGYPISGLPTWMRFFGAGSVLGVQTPIVVMIVVYVVGWVLLERTPFGRYVYAIGGNETATRLSGVRVSPTKLIVYGLSGLASAIAAVVLGGTSIAGGRGSLIGTLLGALLLGVLNNGLNMVGVNPYVQTVVKGGIILLAIYIGRERRR